MIIKNDQGKKMMSFVAILMGSDSDWSVMQRASEVFTSLQISFEVNVLSAHRTPEATREYVKDAEARGCAVFICAAGLAAHLAGFVAGLTLRPVIGVPLAVGSLQGMDALLSTVQMPPGIPVACVAIGEVGAQNAAFLSAQILALQDATLAQRLFAQRAQKAKKILEKNQQIREKTGK